MFVQSEVVVGNKTLGKMNVSAAVGRLLRSSHLVKALGTDHRKEVEVGGVPGHIEGRHESMSLTEGRESRLWVSFYHGAVP